MLIAINDNARLVGYRIKLLKILLGYSFVTLPFFIVFSFFINSDSFGVVVSYLAIIGSLLPVFVALLYKDLLYLLNPISFFNISITWFLLLETIFESGDAFKYLNRNLINTSIFYVYLFLTIVNFFLLIFHGNRFLLNLTKLDIRNLYSSRRVLVRITFFCFLTPLVILLIYYGSFSGLWDAMTMGRTDSGSNMLKSEESGSATSMLLPIIWIWQLVPAFAISAFYSSDKEVKSRKEGIYNFSLIAIIGFVLFVTFLGGSRGALIFVGAPVVLSVLIWKRNKSIAFWISVVLLAISLIGVMEFQKRFRTNLLDVLMNPTEAAKLYGYESATTFNITESHRDNNMYLLALTVDNVPYRSDFEGFEQFFVSILNPIPRAIWKSKPLLRGGSEVEQIPNYLFFGQVRLGTNNLTISAVGEAYLAAGILGLLIYGVFYGLIIYSLDLLTIQAFRYHIPVSSSFIVICLFVSFWSMRGLFQMMAFVYPLATFIVLRILFFKKFYNRAL